MAILTRCDNCDNRMNLADKYAGRLVRCLRCKEPVRVPGAPHQDDDDDSRPTQRRRRKRKKASNFNALWIGVGAGAALMMIAVVAVIVAIAVRKSANKFDNFVAGSSETANPATYPELSQVRAIQPGVMFQSAVLSPGAAPMQVWYYRPEQATGKLPLVLVPPAGSTLVAGMDLGDGDRAEHIPYVKAGFAVGSFEIDGAAPKTQNVSDKAILQGARSFRDAKAGLKNAKAALDFLLAKANDIDENRIFIAGHSSAATLALLVAEHDPRIKGCAAYCAVSDVEEWLAPAISKLNRALPGYRDFIRFSSPKTHVDKLKCPVFLFHARDDTNVSVSQTMAFAELLKKTNPDVTVDTSATGGHYDSMVNVGIPRGIAWMQKR
jgi:dienelactone hydrolase